MTNNLDLNLLREYINIKYNDSLYIKTIHSYYIESRRLFYDKKSSTYNIHKTKYSDSEPVNIDFIKVKCSGLRYIPSPFETDPWVKINPSNYLSRNFNLNTFNIWRRNEILNKLGI